MQDTNHVTTDTVKNNGSSRGDARLMHLERRLLEAFDQLWDSFVDPADALYDVDGTRWSSLGGGSSPRVTASAPFSDEQQLAEIRAQCRALAAGNEFAINGHEYPLIKALNCP